MRITAATFTVAFALATAGAQASTYTLVAPTSGTIASDFGSNADADISNRSGLGSFGDVAGTDGINGWGTGYADMASAFWGRSGSNAEFRIEATDPAKSIRLDSFLAGSYLTRGFARTYIVYDLAWTELWSTVDFIAPTQTNAAALLAPDVSAVGGVILQWGESFNGGINEITFTVGDFDGDPVVIGGGEGSGEGGVRPGVIPLPASLPLLLAGLAGFGLVARRRAA